MKKDINIAEILKDMPKGTKLYSPLCGECELVGVESNFTTGTCITVKDVAPSRNYHYFWKDGRFSKTGECLLFPSKSMRDWSKFGWKKGDVLVSNNGRKEVIFDHFNCYDSYNTFVGKYLLYTDEEGCKYVTETGIYVTANYSIEEKDAAECYVNTIEERFEGKLNKETLEIESKVKCPFKPFDKVLVRNSGISLWRCDLFSHMQNNMYTCMSCTWKYCIPYEGNEHLLGTNLNPEEK